MKTPFAPTLAFMATMAAGSALAEPHAQCIEGLRTVRDAEKQASDRYSRSSTAFIQKLQAGTTQGIRREYTPEERNLFNQQLADAEASIRARDTVKTAEEKCEAIRAKEREARRPKPQPIVPGQCDFVELMFGGKKDGQCK
ncbi:MAG: hypothetical protein WAZ18_00365 [Alphaproteobacteria bacterium]